MMGIRERVRRARGNQSGTGWRVVSEEYQEYQRAEDLSLASRYEHWAHMAGRIRKIHLDEIPVMGRFFNAAMEDLEKQMRISRLKVDKGDVGALLLLPLLVQLPVLLVLGDLLPAPASFMIWGIPVFWAYWVISYPGFKATVVRIKSADEALRIILYMAMQLQMNPGLEGAIRVASQHTSGPVGRDLGKILWDTETRKYSNVKEAISDFMHLWREWSQDFVKSFEFLVDSTTRVGEGRERLIEKGQDNMIESTMNNMKQYARNLSSPVKVLHMAGIMLPLMGIIMFPLISIFLSSDNLSVGMLTAYIAFGYTVILPLFLFFLVKRLIATRPGAYSPPNIENVRDLPPKDKLPIPLPNDQRILLPLFPTSLIIALVIMIPGIIYYVDLFGHIIALRTDLVYTGEGINMGAEWEEYVKQQYEIENVISNTISALTVFWGLAAGIFTYTWGRSYPRKQVREEVKQIEEGIETGLVGMENSLAKNMPVEWSAYDVVKEYEKMGQADHPMHGFFGKTLNNLERNIPFKKAVFGPEGSIHEYPSSLLHSTMQVIVNSRDKGAQAMAENIRTLNDYIQNQQRVEELIKELLDETVSQMKIQARFIAPVITATAATMALMIVETLFTITERLEEIEQDLGIGGGGGGVGGGLSDQIALVEQLDQSLPPTILLLIVSIYLVEVSVILSYFTNGIQHGFDEVNRDIEIGKTLLYAVPIFSSITMVAAIYITPFVAALGS